MCSQDILQKNCDYYVSMEKKMIKEGFCHVVTYESTKNEKVLNVNTGPMVFLLLFCYFTVKKIDTEKMMMTFTFRRIFNMYFISSVCNFNQCSNKDSDEFFKMFLNP